MLALISEGLTNRQIATRTDSTEIAVKRLVSSILTKLDCESRTQAALAMTRPAHGRGT